MDLQMPLCCKSVGFTTNLQNTIPNAQYSKENARGQNWMPQSMFRKYVVNATDLRNGVL